MAFRPMIAKDTGNQISALDWQQIGDNFAAGVPDVMTTKGDIVAGTGIDTGARVGVGANGSYYWADSGATGGVSTSPPARLSVKPGIAAGAFARDAWTAVPYFSSENFDTGLAYTGGIFTVPHGGYYLVNLGFAVNMVVNSADGTSQPFYLKIGLYKNTVFHIALGYLDINDLGYQELAQVYGCDILKLIKSDAIQPYCYIHTNRVNPWTDVTATLTRLEIAPLI